MDIITVKEIAEVGVLVVIAYFYITANKKREDMSEAVVKKAFNEFFGPNTIDETDPNGNTTRVITIDRVLIERLDKYEEKNIREHNEIKLLLANFENNFSELKNQVTEIYNAMKKAETHSTKHKSYEEVMREKIAGALPYFENEKLRHYIVDQCVGYTKWVMRSSEYMFKNQVNMDLCLEELKYSCFTLTGKCEELLSKEVCEEYISKRKEKMTKYFQDIREIKDDRVNDRVNRFVNLSILFMQNNISMLLNVWMKHYGTEEDHKRDEWKRASFNGAEELKRIEEINNNNTQE